MAIDPKCKPGASVDFGAPGEADIGANICGFSFKIPTFKFPPSISIDLPFPPPLPKFKFALGLTCDPKKPIDITAGLEWGGGRVGCFDEEPQEA